jgi:hypothetical protein
MTKAQAAAKPKKGDKESKTSAPDNNRNSTALQN